MSGEQARPYPVPPRRLPVEVQRLLWRQTWEDLLAPADAEEHRDAERGAEPTTDSGAATDAAQERPAQPGDG